MSDLAVLAADKNAELTLEGLLARHQSFSIRPIRWKIWVHPQHDPGCLLESAAFMSLFSRQYERALVVLDHEGCGQEALSDEVLEAVIETKLEQNGWEGRSAALVIRPELESWVWSESPHVPTLLGWRTGERSLHDWLVDQGYLSPEEPKPGRPKEALEAVLRTTGVRRSSALYRDLAQRVSFKACRDRAFAKLRLKLGEWFGAKGETAIEE